MFTATCDCPDPVAQWAARGLGDGAGDNECSECGINGDDADLVKRLGLCVCCADEQLPGKLKAIRDSKTTLTDDDRDWLTYANDYVTDCTPVREGRAR